MSSFLSADPEQSKPKLLDQVRRLMGMRHYSLRTFATHLLENGYNTLTVQELFRPQGCERHDDLHARAQQAGYWRQESTGLRSKRNHGRGGVDSKV
jgi:hypothetical protein